jgi:hypothetical protein
MAHFPITLNSTQFYSIHIGKKIEYRGFGGRTFHTFCILTLADLGGQLSTCKKASFGRVKGFGEALAGQSCQTLLGITLVILRLGPVKRSGVSEI